MQKNKKRYLLFGLFIVLLLVVCYANYRINNGPVIGKEEAKQQESKKDDATAQGDAVPEGGSFAVIKQDRDSTRQKEMDYLDSIAQNEATAKDAKAKAQEQKLELIASMEQEASVESLLKQIGFEDVAVTVHKGSVEIVVNSQQLTDAQVAQILDIARRETKEKAENIKVMPRG